MLSSKYPASETSKIKETKPQNTSNGELPDKSPSNIFLINKELNPMFGVPREKSHERLRDDELPDKSINIPVQKNLNEVKLNVVTSDMIENQKDKKEKHKRSIRQTGLMNGGFNFVKDAMKVKKGKK